MKFNSLLTFLFVFLAMSMSGCDLVGDIFEFSFWVVVIIIALIIGIVVWLFRKLRRP